MRNSLVALLLAFIAPAVLPAAEPAVRIATNPSGIVWGNLQIPARGTADVEKLVLYTNGIRWREAPGPSADFTIDLGKFLRRLRIRVDALDASGAVIGSDELVVNDPRPPFRVRLTAVEPRDQTASASLSASVVAPPGTAVREVEFFVGETSVGVDREAPYSASWKRDDAGEPSYARVVARSSKGAEANDVVFFGSGVGEQVDVVLERIPISVPGARAPLTPESLVVKVDGAPQKIEALASAGDQPLDVILLMDSSESMLEELPMLQQAAREFAREIVAQGGRIALVGFHQRVFWMTPFTQDLAAVDRAVAALRPLGQTHLYDSVIAMLFELQKREGRKALVVLSDGANQGGVFGLDHMVHYARYSGVPIYPVIRNTTLQRLMRFGVGRLQTRRIAQMAEETGATWFLIDKPGQLPGVYRRIASELREQYVLMFYPPNASEDRWHTLLVETRDGRKVRSPRGFFP